MIADPFGSFRRTPQLARTVVRIQDTLPVVRAQPRFELAHNEDHRDVQLPGGPTKLGQCPGRKIVEVVRQSLVGEQHGLLLCCPEDSIDGRVGTRLLQLTNDESLLRLELVEGFWIS